MKFQFSVFSLLLATAFIGIAIGGILPTIQGLTFDDWSNIPLVLGVVSPIWVPSLFVGYTLGRRALTFPIVLCFAISEVAALGAHWAML
jgi:hypothetical protein